MENHASSFVYILGKFIHSHIWSPPGAVGREEPHPHRPQSVLRAEGVGETLVGDLRGSIYVGGDQEGGGRGEGEGGVVAIHSGGGGKDKVGML